MRNYAPLVKGGEALGKAFGGEDQLENQAYQHALGKAMMGASRQAQAEKLAAQADQEKLRFKNMQSGRDVLLQAATGLQQPQLNELSKAMQEGWATKVAEGPPTPEGVYPTVQDRPSWATPEVLDKFNRTRTGLALNDVATGDTNADQLAKALQGTADLRRQDQVISGNANPNAIAAAMAATAGKPTVDVTSSGIGFNPYGDKNDLNTQPFVQKLNIEAQSHIQSALSRSHADGNQLPAEAKMVQFYISLGYPNQQAVEMARSRKDMPLRDLAADLYAKIRQNMQYDVKTRNLSAQEQDQFAEDQVVSAIGFLQRFEKSLDKKQTSTSAGTQTKPPTGIPADARQAPDGNWYVQKNGKYYRVEQ